MEIFRRLYHPRTKAAEDELRRFTSEYGRIQQALSDIALTVLVWGPSLKLNTEVSKKRQDICVELLAQGFNALMSENIPSEVDGMPLNLQEFAQASAAHLVVILVEDAPGAIAEAHDFCTNPLIAHKIFVLAPSDYGQGYSALGAFRILEENFNGVYWYEPEEIRQCRVLGAAIKRAQARRTLYALSVVQREGLGK